MCPSGLKYKGMAVTNGRDGGSGEDWFKESWSRLHAGNAVSLLEGDNSAARRIGAECNSTS